MIDEHAGRHRVLHVGVHRPLRLLPPQVGLCQEPHEPGGPHCHPALLPLPGGVEDGGHGAHWWGAEILKVENIVLWINL